MLTGEKPDNIPGMVKFLLRSFRYRNYRLFFAGQGISLIGTWIQNIAMSWLVYKMTNSAFLLGIVGFAGQIPTFLLSPFAGVMADRWNRHRMLVITQTLAMVQALILALLILSGGITVGYILVLSVSLGLVYSFDIPVRQSFVVDMIENREDLGNAIALNSSMFNGARLLGPSVAGILISTVGEGVCFLINGISYLAVIAALLSMRVVRGNPSQRRGKVLPELKEGLVYAFGSRPIRYVILFVALISLTSVPYTVLMPVFAREILHGGAHTLGFLMGFTGAGALFGAVFLASRKNTGGLVRIIPLAGAVFGFGLIAFSFSRVMWLSSLLLAVVGFGMMVHLASSNTVLQTLVEDQKRGRVMSFYAMAFMGMTPLGSLMAGTLAGIIGAPYTLAIGGACSILGALLFAGKIKKFACTAAKEM
ncbi:transporter, putative [Desulfocucumis palustris]|uniref:Transporter, putative n=1 Tax=Desulfocucumis palustris TaxID=1898651 RepID=A0A2L2X8I4_9FIRM|nr:MFS transporter [Desulfocucumis palustris]GBF32418.1 transporter, putative [Desulfocucumis palustris]